MATIYNLIRREELIKFDANLGPRELEERQFYAIPRVAEWMSTNLPELGAAWKIEQSPAEQVDELLHRFCSGQLLQIDWTFKSLNHLGNGIWELKTADIRIFGFFNRQDSFIATDVDEKQRILDLKLYKPYCEQAMRFRTELDLDEPKFVDGDNPHGVVSNCAFP